MLVSVMDNVVREGGCNLRMMTRHGDRETLGGGGEAWRRRKCCEEEVKQIVADAEMNGCLTALGFLSLAMVFRHLRSGVCQIKPIMRLSEPSLWRGPCG